MNQVDEALWEYTASPIWFCEKCNRYEPDVEKIRWTGKKRRRWHRWAWSCNFYYSTEQKGFPKPYATRWFKQFDKCRHHEIKERSEYVPLFDGHPCVICGSVKTHLSSYQDHETPREWYDKVFAPAVNGFTKVPTCWHPLCHAKLNESMRGTGQIRKTQALLDDLPVSIETTKLVSVYLKICREVFRIEKEKRYAKNGKNDGRVAGETVSADRFFRERQGVFIKSQRDKESSSCPA